MEKTTKLGAAALGGVLAAWWGEVYVYVVIVAAFVVFDFITGVLAAGHEKEINSERMTDGIYKKAGLLLLMGLGFGLDAAITCFAAEGLSLDIPFNLPFGVIVCAWIVINEAISVIENLVRLEVPIPERLTQFLKIAKDKLDVGSGDGS